MTTWYTVLANGPTRDQLAYSVRPDLWPPGTVADLGDHGWLANWDAWPQGEAPPPVRWDGPMHEYAAPGAAEALILSGLVLDHPRWDRTHWPWTEVSPPR